jgi:YggT family protein
MNDALHYVIRFLFEIACFLFVARFLLQACRADFYNPISQGITKITDPILKPMRMVLPGYRNFDTAAFVAAWLTAMLMLYALTLLASGYTGSILALVTQGLLHVLLLLLSVFKWSILIVIIVSFIAPGNYHPALMLLQQITEPLLGPARRLIPPLGGIDFSPILVFLVIGVIERILPQLFLTLF